ncbi:hypothetical protein BVRB_6g130080 [Beta vulgaris subsp. vulgaris]|nr:hypothetical protein BVRB_6g130080 [Beta vulgaris subsp. vulgaris]
MPLVCSTVSENQKLLNFLATRHYIISFVIGPESLIDLIHHVQIRVLGEKKICYCALVK